jgi:hypothetical protein
MRGEGKLDDESSARPSGYIRYKTVQLARSKLQATAAGRADRDMEKPQLVVDA